jgi:hypothetical protein
MNKIFSSLIFVVVCAVIGPNYAHSITPPDSELKSVVGSYTSEELEAALDDYFEVFQISSAPDALTQRVEGIFMTDQIPQIDAQMHNLIFDNGITRNAKLAALFAAFEKSEGNFNKQAYMLDTMGAIRPIELTDSLISAYRGCSDIPCTQSILSTLSSASKIETRGYKTFNPTQAKFVSTLTTKIFNLAEDERRIELWPQVQEIIGSERAAKILKERLMNASSDKDFLSSKYIEALLGQEHLGTNEILQISERLEQIKDPTQKQNALNSIYSAVRELPLSSEAKVALRPIFEQIKPKDPSPSDFVSYIEWLKAYAAAVTLGSENNVNDFAGIFRDNFIKGSTHIKMAILLYGSEFLLSLTAQEKANAESDLNIYIKPLAADSVESRAADESLRVLEDKEVS